MSAKRNGIDVLTEALTSSGRPGSNCYLNINLAKPWVLAHFSSDGWMTNDRCCPSVGLSVPPFTLRSRGLDQRFSEVPPKFV